MATKRTSKKISIQEEDINMLREIYTIVGEMKGIVETTRDQTAENTRTLRGHNGTPGLMTTICNLENKVNDVDGKIEAVKASIKDVPAAIDTMKRYPSLTWLVRHRFREMLSITIFSASLVLLLGAPALDSHITDRLSSLVIRLVTSLFGL